MRRFLGSALLASPPFALALCALVLDRLHVLALDPRLAPRAVLAGNVLLYWGLATLLVALVRERRSVLAFVRRRRVPLLALAVSLGLSLVLAELLVERLGLARGLEAFHLLDSAEFHHVNPPDLDLVDGTGSRVVTNHDGFRAAVGPTDDPSARAEATREGFGRLRDRIAVLGDSYTFGLGVHGDETACRVLEQVLRERLGRTDLGVLNTGVISYSPLLERTAFRARVRAYAPTLVLLFLDGNDIGDDLRYEQQNAAHDPAPPHFLIPEHHEPPALLVLAKPAVRFLRAPFDVLGRFVPALAPGGSAGDVGDGDAYAFHLEIGGVVETNRWFILRHPLDLTRPYFERTFGYVEDIARDVRAADASFALFVLPRYFQWSDRECPDDWAGDQHAPDEPHEYAMFDFFAEAAGRADFPVISLLPAFQATTEFPLCFRQDPHWNPAGHRFVGTTVAGILLERGLVK